jgi:hypothetical protein
VTVKVPNTPGNVTVSVTEAEPPGERTTLDGLRSTVRPTGKTVLLRKTTPLKPLILVMVIVEVEVEPPHPPRTRDDGLAVIE